MLMTYTPLKCDLPLTSQVKTWRSCDATKITTHEAWEMKTSISKQTLQYHRLF